MMLFRSAMPKTSIISQLVYIRFCWSSSLSWAKTEDQTLINNKKLIYLWLFIPVFLVFVELWCSGPTYSKDESYPLDKSSRRYWIIQMVIHAMDSAVQSLNNWSLGWWCSWFYRIRRSLEKKVVGGTQFLLSDSGLLYFTRTTKHISIFFLNPVLAWYSLFMYGVAKLAETK